jgi:glycosyltransferase involved in cell wall biosynthesis
MRILIANEALAGGGGVETYLSAVVPGLQAEGHEIGVLHDNPSAQWGPQRIAPEGTWHVSVQDEGSLERAIDRVREFAPDVCFSHNMRRVELDAALADRWPVVKMMHGHFGTCVSGQKAFLFPSATACTRTFGPGCLAYYFPRRCGEASLPKLAKAYRWGLEQRALYTRYQAIVVASRYMRDEYVRAGAPDARIHTLPLFAPPLAAAPTPLAARQIDVAFLGRLTPLKGPDVLLDAAVIAGRRLGRRINLVMAGFGPLRVHLEKRAAGLAVNATFPGWVSPDLRNQLLSDTAVLAVPSRWQEPFGVVGFEAAAYGAPSIGFDNGGISEWLRHGVNGLLVEASRGAEGFGAAIAELLADPALLARLGDGARQSAREATVAAYVRRIAAVLSGAAGMSVGA